MKINVNVKGSETALKCDQVKDHLVFSLYSNEKNPYKVEILVDRNDSKSLFLKDLTVPIRLKCAELISMHYKDITSDEDDESFRCYILDVETCENFAYMTGLPFQTVTIQIFASCDNNRDRYSPYLIKVI